jgi:multidrug transporter EmrE-like cation transporter
VSWFYFKEKLSALQIVGLIVGIAAIVILEMAGK